VLTDPQAAQRWAPVSFDVDDARLAPEMHARVTGRLAGRPVGFDVEVHEARPDRLALSAHGPVGFDVRYDLAATDGGSDMRASVSVRAAGGITGRVLARATQAMLAAGALDNAVSRIAREAGAC
jgi:hypothetical protein